MDRPARVVLIDDDPDAIELLRLRFGSDPRFSIVGTGSDGVAAIDLARSEAPDIIVIDLQMPRMDGRAAVPLLRQIAPAARIVVISSLDLDIAGIEGLGSDAFCAKDLALANPVAMSAIFARSA